MKKLNIYFIHSDLSNYNDLIYLPVLSSNILSHHNLMFPNSEENKSIYYKDMINKADIIVVELTTPDLTFNMELKQAIVSGKPILALAQKKLGFDARYQKLLKNVIGYDTKEEFRYFVETFAKTYESGDNLNQKDSTVVLGMLN
jgi:nucleoside 2-deoxyribosyltransferase